MNYEITVNEIANGGNIRGFASVVFEDSFNGLKSGKSAQMYVVGLTTAHPAEELVGLCDETIANFKGNSFAY